MCACRRVVHVTVDRPDGLSSERWECNSCRTEFRRCPPKATPKDVDREEWAKFELSAPIYQDQDGGLAPRESTAEGTSAKVSPLGDRAVPESAAPVRLPDDCNVPGCPKCATNSADASVPVRRLEPTQEDFEARFVDTEWSSSNLLCFIGSILLDLRDATERIARAMEEK